MREELEARTQDSFEGTADDAFARDLEADPAALAEYVEQLRIHHRLGLALREESTAFSDSVLRELRYKGDSERFAKGVVGQIKERGGWRRRWVELVAAAFALGALGFFSLRDPSPSPASAGPEVLLVVGQVPLDAGDARVKEHLEKSCRLVIRMGKEVQVDEARGRALVLISSTVDERELKGKFRDVAVPVLTWEPRLFYDMGMIPGSVHRQDWGAAQEQTRLMTASGSLIASSRPAPYSWGKVRADATTIATLEKDPTKAALFRYEAGADMPGLKAPARRAGVFLFDWTAIALTDEGWALFDESVRWCIGR